MNIYTEKHNNELHSANFLAVGNELYQGSDTVQSLAAVKTKY
jgi:hypothetical protein